MEFYYNTKRGELSHEGVKGKSGRYPWGSGDRPYQRLEKPKRPKAIKNSKDIYITNLDFQPNQTIAKRKKRGDYDDDQVHNESINEAIKINNVVEHPSVKSIKEYADNKKQYLKQKYKYGPKMEKIVNKAIEVLSDYKFSIKEHSAMYKNDRLLGPLSETGIVKNEAYNTGNLKKYKDWLKTLSNYKVHVREGKIIGQPYSYREGHEKDIGLPTNYYTIINEVMDYGRPNDLWVKNIYEKEKK